MKVGIDIDGVLTDFYNFLVDYGTKYSIEHNVSGVEDPTASRPTGMFGWDAAVGGEFWEETALTQMSKLPARTFAAEVLRKLHDEGNEIWIVTGRSNYDSVVAGMNGRSWEEITREWLKQNDIVYDKIIFGLVNKAEFCAQYNIAVMVEDDPSFLKDFNGTVKLLIYDAPYNGKYEIRGATRVYSWYDVYAKVKRLER